MLIWREMTTVIQQEGSIPLEEKKKYLLLLLKRRENKELASP